MANNFGKLPDAVLAEKAQLIFQGVAENPERFGLTEVQAEQIVAEGAALGAICEEVEMAESHLRSLIEAKKESRRQLLDQLSAATQRAYAERSVTDAEYAAVGLALRPVKPRRRTPSVPSNFVAKIQSANSVFLTWSRNGNDSRALYRIEVLESGGWRLLDTVTQTKYLHENADSITQRAYRVQAQRGFGQRSAYSSEATVWGPVADGDLKIA